MSARFCNVKWFAVVVIMVLTAGPLFGQGYPAPPPPPWDGTGAEPPITSQPITGQTPPPTYFGSGSTQPPSYLAPPGTQQPSYLQQPLSQPPAPVYGEPDLYSQPPGSVLPPPSPPPGWSLFPATSANTWRFWLNADYLLWWTKAAPLPSPLVTVGSASDPVPGALGQPSTQVIYGGGSIGYGATSGVRLNTGVFIDPEQRFGLQAGFFELASQASNFSAYSDDNGNPLIARPAVDARNGNQIAYVDSVPGNLAGGINISTWSRFLGSEINGMMKLTESSQFRLDGILGFRYLNLVESLDMNDTLYPLGPGVLTYLGAPVNPANFLTDEDYFKTINNFYGGQLGTRMTWSLGPWSLQAVSKLALGATQEHAMVCGNTSMYLPNGSVSSAPGGVLTSTANIGDYYRSVFAVSPEIDLNLRFQISPRWTAQFGYTFIYWSNVLRPGDQVSRTVSPNLIPSDPAYGSSGPNQPQYAFQGSSYWAQGLNFGIDFHF